MKTQGADETPVEMEKMAGGKSSFRCRCGKIYITKRCDVRMGKSKSCGCTRAAGVRAAIATHGMTGTGAYNSWKLMLSRCYNKNTKTYRDYGGRGITVCDRWRNSFSNFYEDMGARPEGMTLDRINTNGNYEPDNCRWSDADTQANNTRRTRFIEWMGITKGISQWAKEIGIPSRQLHWRRVNGWTVEEMLTTPLGKGYPRAKKN